MNAPSPIPLARPVFAGQRPESDDASEGLERSGPNRRTVWPETTRGNPIPTPETESLPQLPEVLSRLLPPVSGIRLLLAANRPNFGLPTKRDEMLSEWASACELAASELRRLAAADPNEEGCGSVVPVLFSGGPTPWDLSELVDEVLSDTRFDSGRLSDGLIREEVGHWKSSVCRQSMRRVLSALLDNARLALIEAQPLQPLLTIRFNREHDRISVSMTDNGVGIAAANLFRLFQPGFTTRKEGRGFGLSDAATAAAKFGGRISAASEGLHRGACFTVSWQEPLRPTASTPNEATDRDPH